ncbi:MAG TPA: hypothetical protein VGR57_01490 [Ktedonobacterales bacterium]|nr:hypothetical protein [Ktedonobacterales bacterium]
MSESLTVSGTSGTLRPRATPYARVACLALLTVAAAYALAAAPALATGQALLGSPNAWLVAPLGAQQAHQDSLAATTQHAELPAAHVLSPAPALAAPESLGAALALATSRAVALLIPALLIAVALALAH